MDAATLDTFNHLVQAGVGTLALIVMLLLALAALLYIRGHIRNEGKQIDLYVRWVAHEEEALAETKRNNDLLQELNASIRSGTATNTEHTTAIKTLDSAVLSTARVSLEAIGATRALLEDYGSKSVQAHAEQLSLIAALREDVAKLPDRVQQVVAPLISKFDDLRQEFATAEQRLIDAVKEVTAIKPPSA